MHSCTPYEHSHFVVFNSIGSPGMKETCGESEHACTSTCTVHYKQEEREERDLEEGETHHRL